MAEKLDSSLVRMLSILDLYSEQRLSYTAEEIIDVLQVAQATGYRYIRILVAAGLLKKGSESNFTLGPKIVVLDYFIRRADPVLQHGVSFIKELVERTGLECVVSSLSGNQLLDTHHEHGSVPIRLSFGRGRPRPLFQGAAPKVILANLSSAPLMKLFDSHTEELTLAGLPTAWLDFKKYYRLIRKTGSYYSVDELETGISAVAVPLVLSNAEVLGAISLVTTTQRMSLLDIKKLTHLLHTTAEEIIAAIPSQS